MRQQIEQECLTIESIAQATGLTIEQIQQLQVDNQ
jgi:predicted transposase YdaD